MIGLRISKTFGAAGAGDVSTDVFVSVFAGFCVAGGFGTVIRFIRGRIIRSATLIFFGDWVSWNASNLAWGKTEIPVSRSRRTLKPASLISKVFRPSVFIISPNFFIVFMSI